MRNTGWWDVVWNSYEDERFKQTFRLSKATFNYVLSFIRDRITKDVNVEVPICPEMRLGICLYRLRGDYMYTIGEMAGIAESTVCQIVIEVSEAIVETLWKDGVDKYFPQTEKDFKTGLLDMDEEWQFPFAFCGIDGSHLPIKCPNGGSESMKQYYNFKNFYSVILLALVDAKYRIIWASLGAPGNTHDSTYFQSTSLWEHITNGRVLPELVQEIDNVEIPPMILADGAFPLRSWICKPHGDAIPTPEKRYFNYRLSRARMVTEGAFGRLKSRFRVLHRKCESHKDTVKAMGLACVVLHNICIEKGDLVPRNLDLTVDQATNKRRSRDEIRDLLALTGPRQYRNFQTDKNAGVKVRNTITRTFWDEKNNE